MVEQHGGPFLRIEPDGIAWIEFDDPDRRVNILSEGSLRTLSDHLEEVRARAADGSVEVVVLVSAKEDNFIAGVDLDLLASIDSPEAGVEGARFGQAIFMDLELLPVPTVAAIHGGCLGGGVEMALACRYRVASDSASTRLAMPEVQLGILPAWGGTTRLPRLIGLRPALELLLTGKPADARKSRRIGLVDAIRPAASFREEVRDFALERVERPIPTGAKRGLLRRLSEETAPGRKLILRAARRQVMKRTGGHYPAPQRILDVLGRSLGRSVERALEEEAMAAGELLISPVCRNLLHVFRLREAARKGTGVEAPVEPRRVEAVGIVGAGVMGGGIGQLMAYRDLTVRLKDIEHEAVQSGLRHARSLFDRAVEKGRLTPRDRDRKMALLSGGLDYRGFGGVDLVVEAVVERMEVKRAVLREAEERVRPDTVLTTNTSTLSIDALAEPLERPGRFAGMHFFNPVHRMPLVEVIRGSATEDGTVATVYALALRLGKVPVVVADGPGFLVNRILGPYMNEAGHLLAQGASVEEVDGAATAFGMPMGPLRLVDEVGIDVMRHAGEVLHEAFGERLKPAAPLSALGATDRRGRKGGLGFYRYRKGKEAGVDQAVYTELADSLPGERTPLPDDEIRVRLVLSMVNEAARALEDEIVRSAADVDLALIMGVGFPPFRGGLLRFADDHHPRIVLDRLEALARSVGTRFEPAAVIREMAESGDGFYARFPGPEPVREGGGRGD